MITYAGIGARATPNEIITRMIKAGKYLGIHGAMLRSGGANGADAAFERGCDDVRGLKQIFLPWANFNQNKSPFYGYTRGAWEMAKQYHPKWEYLLPSTRQLMARTSHVMMGLDMNQKVDFVLCWTKNGEIDGGTGQALRIASDLKIPVINFGNMSLEEVSQAIQSRVR